MDIFTDIYHGFFDSIDFIQPIIYLSETSAMGKKISEMICFNLIINLAVPWAIDIFFGYRVGSSNFIFIILNVLYHNIFYLEIIISINKEMNKSTTKKSKIRMIEMAVMSIIMTGIQICIYLISIIVSLIVPILSMFMFKDTINIIVTVMIISILSVYHSIYCHGLQWQYDEANLSKRINHIETSWVYLLSHGFIPSLLCYQPSLTYLIAYNLYMIFYLARPLLTKKRFTKRSHLKININPITNFISSTVNLVSSNLRQ